MLTEIIERYYLSDGNGYENNCKDLHGYCGDTIKTRIDLRLTILPLNTCDLDKHWIQV